MKTLRLLTMLFSMAALGLNVSCEDNEGGTCSISCGGAGTGQPFVQTNTPFVTEKKCKEMGMNKGGGCKTSYCPPTGDPDDCYQVYP